MSTSNDTTYHIYRIVCFVTGKCYIGQSVHPYERYQRHLRLLRRQKSHSPKLQNAFNKYGESAFFFEVLENDIDFASIDLREKYWIAFFNSFEEGYNAMPGGQTGGQRTVCTWNGQIYPSISAACFALGIAHRTLSIRLKKGYRCDDDVPINRPIPCVWNGVHYPSLSFAARSLGVNYGALRHFINKGYVCDADVQAVMIRPCRWNGIEYKSVSEAARVAGITPEAMTYRLDMGYTCDDDLQFIRKRHT